VVKCLDDAKTKLSAPERRTRAEGQQLVAEFVSSGMPRSEFYQSRGLSFSTLDRPLKKWRWKRRRRLVDQPFRSPAARRPFSSYQRATLMGHRPNLLYVPVPVSGSFCGLLRALSFMVKVPVRAPVTVGEKVTSIVQFAPTRSLAGQLLVS
jgi:hypothetical protein